MYVKNRRKFMGIQLEKSRVQENIELIIKCAQTGDFSLSRLSFIFTTIVQTPVSLWFLLEKYQSKCFYGCTSLRGWH